MKFWVSSKVTAEEFKIYENVLSQPEWFFALKKSKLDHFS